MISIIDPVYKQNTPTTKFLIAAKGVAKLLRVSTAENPFRLFCSTKLEQRVKRNATLTLCIFLIPHQPSVAATEHEHIKSHFIHIVA